jgi:hypothetical protein
MTPSGSRFAISTCAILAHLATTTVLPAHADCRPPRAPVSNRLGLSLGSSFVALSIPDASAERTLGFASLDPWIAAQADRAESSERTATSEEASRRVQALGAAPSLATRNSAGRSLWWVWASSGVVVGLAIAGFAHHSHPSPPDRPPLPDFPGTP